jgi:flavin prenyltransferase
MAEIGPEMMEFFGKPFPPGGNRYVIAVTGASGMLYARELFTWLQTRPDLEVHAVCSPAGEEVLKLELSLNLAGTGGAPGHPPRPGGLRCPFGQRLLPGAGHGDHSLHHGDPGGHRPGRAPKNLIHRAAEVSLKERRPLILVVRETPLSLIHLGNMTRAAQAGAVIFPAMPGFYQRPGSLEEMARNFAGRVLDHLGLEHDLTKRWGE